MLAVEEERRLGEERPALFPIETQQRPALALAAFTRGIVLGALTRRMMTVGGEKHDRAAALRLRDLREVLGQADLDGDAAAVVDRRVEPAVAVRQDVDGLVGGARQRAPHIRAFEVRDLLGVELDLHARRFPPGISPIRSRSWMPSSFPSEKFGTLFPEVYCSCRLPGMPLTLKMAAAPLASAR